MFGKNLKNLRDILGLSQKDMGIKLSISPKTISHWENDDTDIPNNILYEIQKVYKVNINYILTGAGQIFLTGSYGERLFLIRVVLKLSQDDMAMKLGCPLKEFISIEENKAIPTPELIVDICNTYHINPQWLNSGIGQAFRDNGDAETTELNRKMNQLLSSDPDAAPARAMNNYEKEMLEKLKADPQLELICAELGNDELLKNIVFTLLKNKKISDSDMERYCRTLKSALDR